jgi:hypothetical protein
MPGDASLDQVSRGIPVCMPMMWLELHVMHINVDYHAGRQTLLTSRLPVLHTSDVVRAARYARRRWLSCRETALLTSPSRIPE